jgi:hypothetical protein
MKHHQNDSQAAQHINSLQAAINCHEGSARTTKELVAE